MKEDIKEVVAIIFCMIGLCIFFLLMISAIIGIPTFAIIEIIKAIKS